ncbi:MAG: type II toxin-antitoxin system VapC family toxin [Acidimicrobiia bacterium]
MQAQPERIGRHTLTLLADERNELYLSSASAWEIAIKFPRDNVQLPDPPDRSVPDRLPASGVDRLPVEHSHALLVSRLDDHHRDLFDRLLVSQAMLERLPIISADKSLAAYEVEFIDATR